MQLVVNTRGSLLRRRGNRFIISREGASHEFAATKIQSIVIATSVRLTSNAIELATESNVDIVFLNSRGSPTARVWQPRLGSTAAIRRKQLEVSENDFGCQVAVDWVQKKLENQVKFLDELASRRPDAQASIDQRSRTIRDGIESLDAISGTAETCRGTIMGIEGTSGRVYFDALSAMMPKEYRFSGRSRRPAVDGFNAMLNYTYGVLYSAVERACILAGLDPHIGFLHTDNYNKPSLVYDLIEPFRIIGDRVTVLFFTGRRVKADFFREVPGGVELAPDGRAAVISNLNERLDKAVRYPIQRPKKAGGKKYRRIKLRTTIQYEAHALANRLLGRDDLPKIVESEDIFAEDAP